MGEIDQAKTCFEEVLSIDPGLPAAQNNYLHTLLYVPGGSNQQLFENCRRFIQVNSEKRVGPDLQQSVPLMSGERLCVGYLSSDFYNHPVGQNISPLLCNHDHPEFEIYCYSEQSKSDDVTELLRSKADQWRAITGLSLAC